ncbi:universal stress protein [Ammoniphilus resinae]|uniref:Nucleotide-binding universal stress UspA family protein n=1 Tax=Ammoniphilus resinae TaxID=861532 RepID=A0ABS4GLZ7_9BACL|nr:universal stress protein [Ammoniphilus resinae]MBP1931279.1 nucleotide-binding universal stress UspA family protein [Ammoniphilus resinae]
MANLLVPVDGSEHAKRALEYAIPIAKAMGDEIILLNVQPNIETVNVKIFFSKKDVEEYQQQLANEILDPVAKLLEGTGISYRTKIRVGLPKVEICEEARKENVRGIVMGSRGVGPVFGKILGSVSYGVVHEAHCPVTIVP